MSLLFKIDFLGHPIHVLDIRGRVTFFATEIGAAAGHVCDGDRFVTLLTREWSSAVEEDDDVTYLTDREFARVARETGLSLRTKDRLVLFASGARKALAKSGARHARSLQRFLDETVLPLAAAPPSPDLDSDGVPDEATSAPAGRPDPAVEAEAFVRRCTEYLALRRYARLLLVHRHDVDGFLLVEQIAVEALLGRSIWSDPTPGSAAPATDVPAAA